MKIYTLTGNSVKLKITKYLEIINLSLITVLGNSSQTASCCFPCNTALNNHSILKPLLKKAAKMIKFEFSDIWEDTRNLKMSINTLIFPSIRYKLTIFILINVDCSSVLP